MTNTVALTVYVLVWAVIVFAVMGVIGRAFFTEWREARRAGRDII